jgi:hypothetical protein
MDRYCYLDRLDDLCERRGWVVGITIAYPTSIAGRPLTVLEALEVRDDDASLAWPKRDLIASVDLTLNTVEGAAEIVIDQIQAGTIG